MDEKRATRCAGADCTALYHAECWEVCVYHRGSCAILGCGSSTAWGAVSVSSSSPVSSSEGSSARNEPRIPSREAWRTGLAAALMILIGAPFATASILGSFCLCYFVLPRSLSFVFAILLYASIWLVIRLCKKITHLCGAEWPGEPAPQARPERCEETRRESTIVELYMPVTP